jgi:ribosomal silencing factor RsfS
MLTRPVAAALSCRQCQSSIIRAVVSRPATSPFRSFPQTSRLLPSLPTRFYSDVKTTDPIREKSASISPATNDILNDSIDNPPEADESGDVPWFLEVEPPRHPENQHAVELPKVPEGAPEVIEPMIKYIFEDMGLDDISLLDMRELDPPAALGPNLIMLFATARSERHLHISSGRFVRWLRKNHNIHARADGLIGPGELRTKLRRLRKKAKLMGTNTAIIPGGDNGISTGWVCVNFSSNGGQTDEAAKVDDSGRFSGFGAPQTGTTVVVQCMTDSRRAELDLETLWKGILKKTLKQNKQARGEKADSPEELEKLVASKIQLPKSGSALQWQAMQSASQRRAYTTSARRLSPDLVSEAPPGLQEDDLVYSEHDIASDNPHTDEKSTLSQVRKWFENVQLAGLPLTQKKLHRFVTGALITSAPEPASKERLSLIDQILWTAEERGMTLWDSGMFTSLIEGLLISPSYGQPELKRAQKNIETLMDRSDLVFGTNELVRLMKLYGQRGEWPRFWDTFRRPHLYKLHRKTPVYTCVFRVLADTKNQIMCIENLRWIYVEMLNETKTIAILGPLYTALKDCIRVCDPAAEYLLENGADFFLRTNDFGEKRTNPYKEARFKNREYLNVLREVEVLHAEHMKYKHAEIEDYSTAEESGTAVESNTTEQNPAREVV